MTKRQDTDPTRINLKLDPTTRRMSGIAVQGNVPFDTQVISHIEGNLWQGGCENGLVLPDFIKNVISVYPWEKYTVKHALHHPVYGVRMFDDNNSVDEALVRGVALQLNEFLADGPTLIHCQAGLNRSSLVAAYALMLQGKTADEAIALIREKRDPACLCNKTFEAWLRGLDLQPTE